MQEAIVALVVACAAWFVFRRYAPKRAKEGVRGALARGARKLGWKSIAQKLEQAAPATAGCGNGCGACGACDTPHAETETVVRIHGPAP